MSQKSPHRGSTVPSARQRRLAAKKFAKQNAEDRPVDLDGDKLTAAMQAIVEHLKPKDQSAGYFIAAAELVILECLRLPHNSPQAQEFFARPPEVQMSWEYSARIFSVADSLLRLKDCAGFDIFCSKARESDLLSAVSELHAARLFADAGYSIEAIRPSGKKKSDFDFLATKNEQTTSVEVSAFRTARYSSEAVVRKMRDKRKQVPETNPAVIFLVVPEAWRVENQDALRDLLETDSRIFFSMTQAINAVVFMTTHYKLLGENPRRGRLTFEFGTYFNDRARHPGEELLAFIDGTTENHPERNSARGPAADVFKLSTEHQRSPFFDWARRFWDQQA